MATGNSRAATDWAAKRKMAMERAAAIKAERQATLRERRGSNNEMGPIEGIDTRAEAPAAAGPGARRRESASQPTSDQTGGGHLYPQGNIPNRPNTHTDGSQGNLPEWARDFNAATNARRGALGAQAEYDRGGLGFDYENFPEPPSPGGVEPGIVSPVPYAQQEYPDPLAAAQRWPSNMPLGQSDGGIGYQARRAMPRGPMPGESAEPQLSAEHFFGLGGNAGGNGGDAAKFFGLDEPRREPRRTSRRSPPNAMEANAAPPPPLQVPNGQDYYGGQQQQEWPGAQQPWQQWQQQQQQQGYGYSGQQSPYPDQAGNAYGGGAMNGSAAYGGPRGGRRASPPLDLNDEYQHEVGANGGAGQRGRPRNVQQQAQRSDS